MFKAFTDNISSFIGNTAPGSDEDEKKATAAKEPSSSEQQINEAGTDITKTESSKEDTTTEFGDAAQSGSADSDSHRSGKVPPPRPNPPLTTAASVSSGHPQDEKHSETGSTTGSAGSAADSEKKHGLDDKFDEVAEKAKEWGSYLFSMTKSASASVGAKAMELKKVVAENTIIGDFVKEQDKFVTEKKEKARANEAAVPPWVGYNEEEQMRTQMLTLSNDKRNFLRNPPTGVQFHFDYETCYPVAMATLGEDERLQEMRFTLVPKMVTEHDFWRNYFYRVSLIKQSTQLTSLAKQSANTSSTNADSASQSSQSSSKPEDKEPDRIADMTRDAPSADINDAGTEDADVAGGNDEFISDAYNLEISDEDLMREMEALRSSPTTDDELLVPEQGAEWEQELQKELTDFEVVGGSDEITDDALEKEIMGEMSKADLK